MLISSGAILVRLMLATGDGRHRESSTLSTVLVAATPLWVVGGFAVAFALWTTGHPRRMMEQEHAHRDA